MKLSLVIRDVPRGDKRPLYQYDLPNLEQFLPEGAWVSLAYGEDPDGHGISAYVRRSYLDMPAATFVSELQEVVIDPPENWGALRHYVVGRSEVDPDLAANYHANLLAAGWREYGGEQ